MNFAVIPWGKEYLGNRIFASEEGGLNRENRLTPFYDMKCYMEKKKDRMDEYSCAVKPQFRKIGNR